MGETAPTGTGKDVAPLTFLRGALCLSTSYKKSGSCAKLRVDGYAHHAYTTRSGPQFKTPKPNDVMIGTLSRLVSALDKAAKAGVVSKSLPIYLTEFGIQSTPDPIYGVSLQRQAEYRSYSERIAYYNSRVKAFSQYLLTDDKKDELLHGIEDSKIKLDGVDAKTFFATLVKDTQKGFFADPIYGGNKDMAAWKMIGFPGARYDYRDWIDRHNERYPNPPVSIADHPTWSASG